MTRVRLPLWTFRVCLMLFVFVVRDLKWAFADRQVALGLPGLPCHSQNIHLFLTLILMTLSFEHVFLKIREKNFHSLNQLGRHQATALFFLSVLAAVPGEILP